LQNFRSKNNILKENIWLTFLFNICHYNSGLKLKIKNYYITSQNFMYFIRENSQNLCQKRKWALWMRHLSQKSINLTRTISIFPEILKNDFFSHNQSCFVVAHKKWDRPIFKQWDVFLFYREVTLDEIPMTNTFSCKSDTTRAMLPNLFFLRNPFKDQTCPQKPLLLLWNPYKTSYNAPESITS
jgi:hypothetical protein